MLIKLTIEKAQLEAYARNLVSDVLGAASQAVESHTTGLEKDLEQLTRNAAGGKLWKAWASKVYPRDGRPAYGPSGSVFINGGTRSKGAMTYWAEAGETRSRSGKWLAIPTKFAGRTNRSRNISPKDWEIANGIKLRRGEARSGEAAVLYAQGVLAGKNGVGVRAATDQRTGNKHYRGKKTQDVPIFILIPLQKWGNKFSIDVAVERRMKMMIGAFERHVENMQQLSNTGA